MTLNITKHIFSKYIYAKDFKNISCVLKYLVHFEKIIFFLKKDVYFT